MVNLIIILWIYIFVLEEKSCHKHLSSKTLFNENNNNNNNNNNNDNNHVKEKSINKVSNDHDICCVII